MLQSRQEHLAFFGYGKIKNKNRFPIIFGCSTMNEMTTPETKTQLFKRCGNVILQRPLFSLLFVQNFSDRDFTASVF